MHPYHHALSSVQKWGGRPEDYQAIHDWFNASKSHYADVRHRALRHHAQGIFWAEEVFGTTITNSDGRVVPVRFIGEQHVREDLGWIPSLKDWLRLLPLQPWMRQVAAQPERPTKGETRRPQKSASRLAAKKPPTRRRVQSKAQRSGVTSRQTRRPQGRS